MYTGAKPRRHLNTRNAVLNFSLCRTGSQWSCRITGVMRSYFLAPSPGEQQHSGGTATCPAASHWFQRKVGYSSLGGCLCQQSRPVYIMHVGTQSKQCALNDCVSKSKQFGKICLLCSFWHLPKMLRVSHSKLEYGFSCLSYDYTMLFVSWQNLCTCRMSIQE